MNTPSLEGYKVQNVITPIFHAKCVIFLLFICGFNMSEKDFILYQQAVLQTAQTAMVNAQQEVPALISSVRVTPDGIILRTTTNKLHALALYLRNSTMFRFRALSDTAVVDRLLPAGRFVVNYNLLSMTVNQRVVIQLAVSETEPIPSLLGSPIEKERLYPAAD
jgi:NADH:ubiquinone oxidoreductase subunit C